MDRYDILLKKKPKKEPKRSPKKSLKRFPEHCSPEHGLCGYCANNDGKFNIKERIPECRECNWLLPGTEDHWKQHEFCLSV